MSISHIKNIIEENTGLDSNAFLYIDNDHLEITAHIKTDLSEHSEALKRIEHTDDFELHQLLLKDYLNSLPPILFPSVYDDWMVDIRSSIEARITTLCENLVQHKTLDRHTAALLLQFLMKLNPSDEVFRQNLQAIQGD